MPGIKIQKNIMIYEMYIDFDTQQTIGVAVDCSEVAFVSSTIL